jgi:MFS family permease
MNADVIAPSIPGDSQALPRLPLGVVIPISVYYFALNLHWNALAATIIPSQIQGLLLQVAPRGSVAEQATWVTAHTPFTLAVVAAPGLVVALLANPFFGLLSDRTPGRFGRRRPYILVGTVLNVVGLVAMAFLPGALISRHSGNPLAPSILVLMGGGMFIQLVSNCAQAPFHALLPDFIPREQRGQASGVMGLAQLLGSIAGFVVPALFGFNASLLLRGGQTLGVYNAGIVRAYAVVAATILILALVTVVFVHEVPWCPTVAPASTPSVGNTGNRFALTVGGVALVAAVEVGLLKAPLGLPHSADAVSVLQVIVLIVAALGAAWAFELHPRRTPDFTWVIVTRMLVQLGIWIPLSFLLLIMQHYAKAPNPAAAVALFGTILAVTATLTTAIAGAASDRFGRKRMVYVSGGFMALVGAAFLLAPHLVASDLLTLAYVAGAVFGLGYGTYVSVDWALVADVLPSETTYARDMGVWNIGQSVPQVLAVVFGAWLLALGARLGSEQLGYEFLFAAFIAFCLLGTVTVRNIRGAR